MVKNSMNAALGGLFGIFRSDCLDPQTYCPCQASSGFPKPFLFLGGAQKGLFHIRPVPKSGGEPTCEPPSLWETDFQQPHQGIQAQTHQGWRGKCPFWDPKRSELVLLWGFFKPSRLLAVFYIHLKDDPASFDSWLQGCSTCNRTNPLVVCDWWHFICQFKCEH